MDQLATSKSLEQGIQTARGGHRLLARLHLEQASQDLPQEPEVWMWLAWVADSPTEAAEHLRKARAMSPNHPQAEAGLQWIESLCVDLVKEPPEANASDSHQEPAEDDAHLSTVEIPVDPANSETWESEVDCDENSDTYEWSVDELLDSAQSEWHELDENEVDEVLELEAEPVVLEITDDESVEYLEVAELFEEEPADTDDSLPVEHEESPKPPRVLLLDASPTFRKLATLALTRAGYEVESTDNELYALEHLAEIEPSVILVDSSTPNVGGYQLCKLIKKHAETRHIPVLLLSGEDKLFDRMRGRLSGCAGSLAKPISWESLVSKVERHVARSVAS